LSRFRGFKGFRRFRRFGTRLRVWLAALAAMMVAADPAGAADLVRVRIFVTTTAPLTHMALDGVTVTNFAVEITQAR
jgi:hypothetical protein